MAKQPDLTLLLRQPPFGQGFAREALDVVLAGSAFVDRLAIVFLNEGVLQLRAPLDGRPLGLSNFSANLGALPSYGVTELYAHEPSLRRYGMTPDEPTPDCQLIDDASLQRLIGNSRKVLAL